MPRPKISWFPLRHLSSAIACGHPSLEDWLSSAYQMGLRHLAVDARILPGTAPEVLRALSKRMQQHELGVSAVNCTTDFVHPDPDVRQHDRDTALASVDLARTVGAATVVVTAGQEHPGQSACDSLIWCAESLTRVADEAHRVGVTVALENRYRDPRWSNIGFAAQTCDLLALLDSTSDSPLSVCFNTGAPLMVAEDPLSALEPVADRVHCLHVADRFPGQQTQTVLGEGAVDFDALFACLVAVDYTGSVCLADGNPTGDAGTDRGLHFLRAKIAQWWG